MSVEESSRASTSLRRASMTIPPVVALIPKMTTVYIVRHADKDGGGGVGPAAFTGGPAKGADPCLHAQARQSESSFRHPIPALKADGRAGGAGFRRGAAGIFRPGCRSGFDLGELRRPPRAGGGAFKHGQSDRRAARRKPGRPCRRHIGDTSTTGFLSCTGSGRRGIWTG